MSDDTEQTRMSPPPGRVPAFLLAAMMVLVTMVSGNLSGIGLGDGTMLYDAIALPRLVIAVVLVLAAWAVWLLAASRDEPLRFDTAWVILGVLVGWALLSLAFSPHRALALLGQSERLEGLVAILLYAALYGIALQALSRVEDLRVVASCLGGSAVVLSVMGLAQYAGIDPTDYSFEQYGFDIHRAFATFGNPNFFAGLLVLALPVIVALALNAAGRVERVIWSAGALIAVMALFATFTRGAWLAVGIELLLGAILWARAPKGPMSRRIQGGLAAVFVALLVLVVISLNAPAEINVVSRVTEAFQQTGSASERTLLVGIAGAAAAKRPLLGYGPDTFLPVFRLHRTDAYVEAFHADGIVNNAHSWPLQFAATLGFVGAALLVAAILVALWRGRKAFSKPGTTPGGMVLAAVWVGCLGFAVHMALSVSVLGATVPFWVLLGALGTHTAKTRDIPRTTRTVAGAVVALLCVASLAVSFAFVSADASYLAARRAFSAGDTVGSLALSKRARSLNPVSVKYARGTAEASGELVVEAIGRGADPAAVRDLYAAALADYELVLRLDPNDYPTRAWLAALQARVGIALSEEPLISAAVATARIAATLDRDHIEVTPLLSSVTELSIDAAAGVRRLP